MIKIADFNYALRRNLVDQISGHAGTAEVSLAFNENGVFLDLDDYDYTITDLRISATDGTAFIDHASEITIFAYGNYLIEIEDNSGKKITAYLGETGTGEVIGTTINSGILTEGLLYKIVATTADHFGTGLIVGDYFTSAGTETCDATNTVGVVITPSANGVVLEDVI